MVMLKCQVCGYIINERKLKDVCPACGSKREVFELYEEKISNKRLKLLEAHIHPLFVHFPVAITLIILILSILQFFIASNLRNAILNTIYILCLLLPIFVLMTILFGILDGKTRLKAITPLLKQKIILGSVFLILSIIILVLAIISLEVLLLLILFLSVVCFICGGLLSKIGGTLICIIKP